MASPSDNDTEELTKKELKAKRKEEKRQKRTAKKEAKKKAKLGLDDEDTTTPPTFTPITSMKYEKKSTESFKEIEKRIDRISSPSTKSLRERYRERYGEELHVPEMFDVEVEQVEEEDAEEVAEAVPEEAEPSQEIADKLLKTSTPSKPILKSPFKKKAADKDETSFKEISSKKAAAPPGDKLPWHDFKCLLISQAVRPQNNIVKIVVLILDIILWVIPMLPIRVIYLPIKYMKNKKAAAESA